MSIQHASTPDGPTRPTGDALERHLTGRLITPDDEDYDEARAVWNGMIDREPALIARCAGTTDVRAAIEFARRNHPTVSIRGGGHHVAGDAVCDGGLVVDLSRMNTVDVHPDAGLVRVQGGATLADVDRATQAHGLATPLGVVSRTGVAGLTLGGGIGWLRSAYGLTCDNLVAAEVVTADGRVVRTSERTRPELLWGLRGGGGNFGVVTEFEYRLHRVGPEVMFAFVLYHADALQEALAFYDGFCADAPDEVSSFAICGDVPAEDAFPDAIHGQPYVLFAACHSGSVEDGREALAPLREFADPMVDLSGPMSYADEVQTLLDDDYPSGALHYYWKSLYLDRLDDRVIDAVSEWSRRRPSPLSTVDLWPMRGAVSRVATEATAFGDRSAPYLLGVEANWVPSDPDDENIAWTRACIDAMRPFSRGGEYLNFPGFLEDRETTLRATFGPNYRKLVELKDRYDPTNLFRMNQNIPPSDAA